MTKKKSKKIKLSFFVAENIIFFITALFCVVLLIYTHFISCEITRNVIMSIATSVLASVMIPFSLNVGKIVHEKRILNAICKSTINHSILLIENLNNHIALSGQKPFSCYSDLKKQKAFSKVDFENIETFDELFMLIPDKLSRILELNYISKTDVFELIVNKIKASMSTAVNENNYVQLFNDLTIVIGVVGNIKSPVGTDDYIKQFDDELKKSCREIDHIYFKNTGDYIVQCIENDLSEKWNEG